jgi:hypothetical protein
MAYDLHTVWPGAICDSHKGWPNSQDTDITVFNLPAFQKQHIDYDKINDVPCSISWIYYIWRGQICISENLINLDLPSLLYCFVVRLLCVRIFYTKINDCITDCLIKYRFVQREMLWRMCWYFLYRLLLISSNDKHFYRRDYKDASEFLYLNL